MLEVELKFTLPESCLPQLRAHPLLMPHPVESNWLINRYFDTPDAALRSKGWALRIRSKRGRFYQTLKGKGSVDGARHARLEWECALPPAPNASTAPELDWSVWAAYGVPDDVLVTLQPLWTDLREQFTTNFQREQWQVSIPATQGGGVIEVALDQGAAEVRDAQGALLGSAPILELELEQQGCTEAALLDFAQQLQRALPLTPSSISKAQRGTQLLQRLHTAN